MSEELKNEETEEEKNECCHSHEEHEDHHDHGEHEDLHDHGEHGHHHHGRHHHDDDHEHHHHGHDHEDHDHEHHHHDHDDECCGHDHGHHHDHDDECCDHDHEHHHHDHGHTWEAAGYKLVETHLHEGATVCSFEKNSTMDAEAAKSAMEESILELEHWLEAEDALIGHVKGYVKSGGKTATFSTVGNAQGLNVSEHESKGLTIGFASIVFGPSEEELKDKVIEVFERLK